MITRKFTAICAAIFLVTICNEANAKRNYVMDQSNNVTQFCGDRYCGYVESIKLKHYSKKHYSKKINKEKPIKTASIGNEPIHEAPISNGGLLATAKSYLGTNPTGWNRVWCARFIAVIAPTAAATLKRMGLNPNWARDYAKLPGAKAFGQVGDIVVLSRGSAGHIGVLSGFDKHNNPIVISGNHIGKSGHRFVGISTYDKSRVIAYASI